jgi:hypothetical protein
VQNRIKVNSKDTIILLAEIRSILEVQIVVWQKGAGNGEWENVDISKENYRGSRVGLYVPCLIINDCRSEEAGFYRLLVESSESQFPSRALQVCVERGKRFSR